MAMDGLRRNRLMMGAGIGLMLGGAVLPAAPVAAQAANVAPNAEPDRCAALLGLEIHDTTLFSAVTVKPARGASYCRVQGMVHTAIHFELRMPITWNHKFLMAGCGGFCGGMLTESPVFTDAVSRGYAAVVTDTGHWGAQALDARWARNNAVAREDFSWRGVNATTHVSKEIVRTFYGRDIDYSYYDGCSNGGRQGLMEASRFPTDYDGVIAGAPARDVVGLTALFTSVLRADTGADGKPVLTQNAIDILKNAVARVCGKADGLVDDSASCGFRPESLLCRAGETAGCLTVAQVETANRLYRGPVSDSGQRLFPSGEPFGSERFWMPPGSPQALLPLKLAGPGLMETILSDPAAAPGSSLTGDLGAHVAAIRAIGDPMTPSADLRAFAARKGKLLLYQGSMDQMVPPATTVEYYEAASRELGPSSMASVRLFMVPGMAHCANPAGVDAPGFDISDIDPLTAMERWVEQGIAPASLPAEKRDPSGKVTRRQALCAFRKAEGGATAPQSCPAS